MSNTDASQYTLRYNEITQALEAAYGNQWFPLTLAGSGGISQLTGDVTAGPGSGSQASTLATVNSNVGSFTAANITVNAKGLITAASNGSGGAAPNVVVTVDTTGATTTSSTPIATSAAVTITPSSNTAKIRISVSGSIQSANPSASPVHITLLKDGTNVSTGTGLAGFFDNGTSSFAGVPASFVWLDTPGNTSAHIYTVALFNADASTQVRWLNGGSDPAGVIIAEEVH